MQTRKRPSKQVTPARNPAQPLTATIPARIEGLKAEFVAGQKMLADLGTQRSNLEATMLRISGAIQVLEELLAQDVEQDALHEDPQPEQAQ